MKAPTRMLALGRRSDRYARVGLVVCAAVLATALTAPVLHAERKAPEGWRMQATAYCQTGKTSSGVEVRTGMIAADPRVLPQGSTVRIISPLRAYSGTYAVEDTGAKVKGRIIDIYIADCAAARLFGRRAVTVYLVDSPAPRAVATR